MMAEWLFGREDKLYADGLRRLPKAGCPETPKAKVIPLVLEILRDIRRDERRSDRDDRRVRRRLSSVYLQI